MLCFRETTIGRIGIEERDGCIVGLWLPSQKESPSEGEETPLLREAFAQLEAYLAGRRRAFDLPLKPEGTPFMQKVWRALCSIPYGKTASYKAIAEAIGNPKACRAVGMANNRNPISIFIPCHRIIGSNGTLVGYGGGLDMKQTLLELERRHASA